MEIFSERIPQSDGAQKTGSAGPPRKEKLTHEELENFWPYCVVCTVPIPMARAKRRHVTCSPECIGKLRQWRRYLLSTRKCLACLAPYTPKQRAEFKAWRIATGQQAVKRGMKLGQKKRKPEAPKEVDTEPVERDSISANTPPQ